MAQTNLNIRMDEDLKRDFNTFCEDIGMSMSTAICIFAKTAVREQRIPFELKREPNAQTRAALAEYETMKEDSSAYRRYPSFEALMKEVLTDA